MANRPDLTLCEAHVLHSATGDAYSCRKKKHWWQSTYEAKGTFVKQSSDTYAVKFNLSEREVCRHELPRAGKAVILRHRPNEKTKSLFIAEIKEHGVCRDELLTLTLSFSVPSDFVTWEEELRNKLKVYSFHIEIEENQIVQKGPATLHLTVDYIYITTNNVNGKFKALYYKNRRKSTIVCCHNRTCYSLEIHCLEGHTETIEFQSKHFELIRETLKYFENIVIQQTEEIASKKESCREDIKKQFNKRSLSEEVSMKDGRIENIKLYHPPIQPSELRYSKAKVSKKTQTHCADGEVKISSMPCIYSYEVLDSRVDSVKTDHCNKIYVSSKELRSLKAIENGDFSGFHSANGYHNESTFSDNVFVSKTESETEGYLETGLNSESRAHSPHFGSQPSLPNHHVNSLTNKSSIDASDIISKGSIPVTGKEPRELSDNQPLPELSCKPNTGLIPEVVVVNVPLEGSFASDLANISKDCRHGSETKNIVDTSCTQEPQPQSENDLDSGIHQSRKTSSDYSQQVSISAESDRLRKSPKGRRSVEDWIPRNLSQENLSPKCNDGAPPLFPRKSSPSLQPHLHFYENLSAMVHSDEKNDSSKSAIETVMYVFGNEMTHGGAWTVGVIVLQRDDSETFERLKKLENEFGRHQLTPPRSFDMTSDIKISVNDCSQGFGVLGLRSHTLRYGDMEQLGPSKWIVVEFHFLHSNEKFSIFKFDIGVEPVDQASETHHQSHYTSQTISFVKKLARSESLPEYRGMLPPLRSRLPLKATNRQELCRDLDLPTSLGDNWKGLAAKIGLDIREIRIIEHGKHDSCAEEVLQILEYRFPEKCTVEFLTEVLTEIRRPDLIEHLQ